MLVAAQHSDSRGGVSVGQRLAVAQNKKGARMNRFVQSVFAEELVSGFEAELDAVLGSVSKYPIFDYSMRDVKRAGEMISGTLPWTDETAPQIRRVFQIANSWRDAHAYPMRSIR